PPKLERACAVRTTCAGCHQALTILPCPCKSRTMQVHLQTCLRSLGCLFRVPLSPALPFAVIWPLSQAHFGPRLTKMTTGHHEPQDAYVLPALISAGFFTTGYPSGSSR